MVNKYFYINHATNYT